MNIFLYGITIIMLAISFYKDKKKTILALRKAWKAFEHILPEFLVVIIWQLFLRSITKKVESGKLLLPMH